MAIILDTLSTPNPYVIGYPGQRKIAVRPDGRIYVTWDSDTGAVITYSDDHGDTWSDPQLLDTTADLTSLAALWADDVGAIHVVATRTLYGASGAVGVGFYYIAVDGTVSKRTAYMYTGIDRTVDASICSSPDGKNQHVTKYHYRETDNHNYIFHRKTYWDATTEVSDFKRTTLVNSGYAQHNPTVFHYGPDDYVVVFMGPSSPPYTGLSAFVAVYRTATDTFDDIHETVYASLQSVAIEESSIIKTLDVLDGIPYLSIRTQDSIEPDRTQITATIDGVATTFEDTTSVAFVTALYSDGTDACLIVNDGGLYYIYKPLHSLTWVGTVLEEPATNITAVTTAPNHQYALYYESTGNTVRFIDFSVPEQSVTIGETGVVISFGDSQ